jgi:hypothetical protein
MVLAGVLHEIENTDAFRRIPGRSNMGIAKVLLALMISKIYSH